MDVEPGQDRGSFSRYWGSAFLADLGDGVRLAAFPLLAVSLTRSPLAVVTVTAVQGLPWLAFGPGIGVLVDRLNLQKLMVVVDVLRIALIGALVVVIASGAASLPLLYCAAFATAAGSVARDAAASTALPRLVATTSLDVANGRLVATSLVSGELAGPAVGGWLFAIAAGLPFALNAAGLGLAVLLLLTLPNIFAPTPAGHDTAPGPVRSVRRDIRAGMSWLWRDRVMRRLTTALFLVFLADGAFLGILVLYVSDILSQPPDTYGVLLGAGAVGGIAAGFTCARLVRRIGSTSTLTLTMLAMAVSQLVIGLTTHVVATAVALATSGAAFATFNVISRTLRQRLTPPAMLGRVTASYLTVARCAEASGAVLGGALATAAGVRAPILAGIPLLLLAIMAIRGQR